MFEALFILTLLETGTRVARFVFQETVQQFRPRARPAAGRELGAQRGHERGGLLPVGLPALHRQHRTLWRMMGIANQLLATIALAIGTTYLLKHASRRIYALCTGIPLVFVVVTVFTAGVQSIQSWRRELACLAPGSPDAFYLQLVSILSGIMLGLWAWWFSIPRGAGCCYCRDWLRKRELSSRGV